MTNALESSCLSGEAVREHCVEAVHSPKVLEELCCFLVGCLVTLLASKNREVLKDDIIFIVTIIYIYIL